jgi:phosphatidylserine/phosphatidylglycerophosphate/cardiolipin synthase-like enzyme
LARAHEAGIQVRILLDRDRATDPYRSTVINANAKAYPETHGVSCKFDREDRLLHSKYVLVDEDLVVLGSHNWSAGSYFLMDDLSVAVRSESLVQALRARFDTLWASS